MGVRTTPTHHMQNDEEEREREESFDETRKGGRTYH